MFALNSHNFRNRSSTLFKNDFNRAKVGIISAKKDTNKFQSSWALLYQRLLLRLRSRFLCHSFLQRILLLVALVYSIVILINFLGKPPGSFKFNIFSKKDRIVKLEEFGFKSHPLVFAYHTHESKITKAKALNPYVKLYPSKRTVFIENEALKAQERLEDEKKYNHGMKDQFEEGDCVAQYEWQLSSFPTCNMIHEANIFGIEEGSAQLVNNGYWRDVWTIQDADGSKQVLKTLRYEHDFEDRNYDRHRRDALAMEHLTSSKYVVDIYSFCGNSGIFEYSANGDIESLLWPDEGQSLLTLTDKLKIAVQVAMGITDTHTIDAEDQASIAHTDITPGQFIMIDGFFKLNDFNRCRFIRWNERQNEPCGYEVNNNPGKFRAPEEYQYKELTEKIDVYSMGNIFYTLLTNEWPFERLRQKKVYKMVASGERPGIDEKLLKSNDPIVMVLIQAISMCWVQNPKERATAREVENYLSSELANIFKSNSTKNS